MRGRTRTGLAVVACALGSIVAASAAQAAGGKVLICHGTASDTNPYVLISVSESAAATHLDGHGQSNHPDFLLPSGKSDCSDPQLESGLE
jgi:ABC-type sugar transport system substrate-binding protein